MTALSNARRGMRDRLGAINRWGMRAGIVEDRTDHSANRRGDEVGLSHYDALLESEAQLADVPADLLKAICWYSSGWRQYEPNGKVLSTPTQAGTSYGCMQLNDVWHPDAFPSAMHDAQANIRYAANLLLWLHEQAGSWERATTAFFGHDRRAEVAARRVERYRRQLPWKQRQDENPPAPNPHVAARGNH